MRAARSSARRDHLHLRLNALIALALVPTLIPALAALGFSPPPQLLELGLVSISLLLAAGLLWLRRDLLGDVTRITTLATALERGEPGPPLTTRFYLGELDRLRGALALRISSLREHLKELEQREHLHLEHTRGIEQARAELEQVNYIVSHHLREPLIRVTTYLEMFGRHYRGRLDATGTRFLKFAEDGIRRIEHLIDDLSLYAESIHGPVHRYPTDTAALVRSILEELDIEVAESSARIDVGALPTVLINPNEIARVFRHLLSNAIRFRRSEAPQITVTAEERDNETIFAVTDNGIGIDAAHQAGLFSVFDRVHTDPRFVGTGVGLALCRKIVEHHGGWIRVTSAPGKGSTFSFGIPRETPITEGPEPEPHTRGRSDRDTTPAESGRVS